LGRHTATVDAFVNRAAAALGSAPGVAVFFCDQNKALERISLQWVESLFRRWELPPWLLQARNSLVDGRRQSGASTKDPNGDC
jgi:hypothetical protein